MVPVVQNKFRISTKTDMVRLHILIKCYMLNNIPEESVLSVLVALYNHGGIKSCSGNNAFINFCVENKLRGSAQSVRNILSDYTELGLLVKPRNCIRLFKEELLPELPEEFALSYFITNISNAVKTK